MSGIYLVTAPIGNSEDITLRAKEVLIRTKSIYCEDTRVLKKLLKNLAIDYSDKHITSFHDHSDDKKLKQLIEKASDEDCVFISDAGSPIISDPAFPIIKAAIAAEIKIKSTGGISSLIYALELSGLPPIPLHFYGFLARDNSKKNKDYQVFEANYGTHIFYEGVSRVKKTLLELTEQFPNFDFVVARELTKEFESVYRFKGSEYQSIETEIVEKGEFVILLHNPTKENHLINSKLIEMANEIVSKGAKPKLVSKLLCEITGQNSKEIYNKLNSFK